MAEITVSPTPTLPLTLRYDDASGELQGFPAGSTVYVTSAGGTPQPFVVGTDPILFKAGDSYNIGGINVSFTGKPADGDTFTLSANTNGASDNRNAHALSNLQTKPEGPEKFAMILSEMARRLAAMDRYERRALSRRKFAIRAFDAGRGQIRAPE